MPGGDKKIPCYQCAIVSVSSSTDAGRQGLFNYCPSKKLFIIIGAVSHTHRKIKRAYKKDFQFGMDHRCFLFVGGGGRIRPCFPHMLSLVTVDKIIAPLLKKIKNSSEASSAIFYPEAAFIYQFICYGKRTRAPS